MSRPQRPSSVRVAVYTRQSVADEKEFGSVTDVAVDSKGRIYGVDQEKSRVVRIDSMSGKGLLAFGKPGKGKGQFYYPCGICIDACPFDALFWSPEFEYAEYDIRELLHESDRLREWMWTVPSPAAHDPNGEPAKEEIAAQKAAG